MSENSNNNETLQRVAVLDSARQSCGHATHQAALDAGQYGKVLRRAERISANPAQAEAAVKQFTGRLKRQPLETEEASGVQGISQWVR